MSTVYIDSNSEFYNTYKLYREYIGYTGPISYRKWMRLRQEEKIAALYCQFYREITLAWYKVKTQWSIEEEGVECINQYLKKNVAKIEEDKKRFDPRYIYKVAYNCLYCLCIDPSKNKDRYYNETPATFTAGEDELDWFDFVGEVEDHESKLDFGELQEKIESLEEYFQVYIQRLFGELTDYQACCRLKSAGYIKGNVREKWYQEYVLKYLDTLCRAQLKAIFQDYYWEYFYKPEMEIA